MNQPAEWDWQSICHIVAAGASPVCAFSAPVIDEAKAVMVNQF
ncbi:hypothetical protein [Neorhizobium turbinariae]|nr:hypothetical protein [Neorhizobium turbinariae]